ncbi:MAG: hypothetical protein WBG46_14105 [Nonlabens sp.]
MKRILFYLLVVTSILVSCSDDDDSNSDTIFDPAMIQGTWNLEDADIDGTTQVEITNQPVTVTSNTMLTAADFMITFSQDGNYSGQGTSSYVTTTPGLPDQVNNSDINSATGTYLISNNDITFDGDSFFGGFGDTSTDFSGVTFVISSLTSSQLILDIEGTVQQELFGTESDIDVDGFIEFSR